jgi:hypothetical protein
MKNGFDDAARKQDHISDSLVVLHNNHRSLTDGQTQIARELVKSAAREQAILGAISDARDMIVNFYATSTEQTRSQLDSHQCIRAATDAHSDALERLYQTLEAIKTQHQQRHGAPETLLHLKLRLPLTRSVMEFVIRPVHDESCDGIVSAELVIPNNFPYT